MKRALAVSGLLGFAALVMAARPGTEFQLDTQLNGQNTRWTMADGGKSGIFTQVPDGGALNPSCGCMLINNAKTLICSQLVDEAYGWGAGVQLFTDGRLPGLVSPGDLYRRLAPAVA